MAKVKSVLGLLPESVRDGGLAPVRDEEALRVFGELKRTPVVAFGALCQPKHVDAPHWRPVGTEQRWKCGTCYPPVSSDVEWREGRP